MRCPLLVVSAACILAGAPAAMAQVAEETIAPPPGAGGGLRQEAPLPENPAPGDARDYQAPAETQPGMSDSLPGIPATPPGAVETPSRPPVQDPADVAPSAGAPALADQETVSAYLEKEGSARRDLVGRPVATPSGEIVGKISEFVVRSGVDYAHLSLQRTADSAPREVVVSLDRLHVASGSEAVLIDVKDRRELEDLPRYDPGNFQTVR